MAAVIVDSVPLKPLEVMSLTRFSRRILITFYTCCVLKLRVPGEHTEDAKMAVEMGGGGG
jgi:hypothetical protein